KAVTQKSVTKKAAVRQTAAPVAKKVIGKKTAAKKSVAKKAPTTTAATKKVVTKKAPIVPTTARNRVSRKITDTRTPTHTAVADRAALSIASRPLQERPVTLRTVTQVSAEERKGLIEKAAYYRAEKRHFAPGHEHEDWVAAEAEVDEMLRRNRSG
ncbi:MAG: DUF2934 domain-containing protein, partial [Thiohalocapsa sp.]